MQSGNEKVWDSDSAESCCKSKMFFDRRDHTLVHMVNDMITGDKSHLQAQRRFFHYLHPRGIKEMSESKGLRIAYAVIHLLESLESGQIDHRLSALRALRDEVLCSSDMGLRRNTARVLIEIMKDLVRACGSYARQIELAHDFRIVASGKPRIVRNYLDRYHLLEMPEEWNQLAFDDHVHDANTKGRKSATHLIMDAWIKGIRRLRVIYYNFIRPETAEELMEAAAIMGITVRIGIEFFASFYDRFAQIIWVPRGFADARDFMRFLDEPAIRAFMDEGRAVSDYQRDYVLAIFDEFNRRHRLTINSELEIDLPPLDRSDFFEFVGLGQASLLHLAKFIHGNLLLIMHEKVRQLKQRLENADADERRRIETMIDKMDRLDLETVHERFLAPEQNPKVPNINKTATARNLPPLMQLSPCELIDRLSGLHSGYRITLNLSNLKVEDVLEMLYECRGRITRLEIFNLKDFSEGKMDHIPAIHELQQSLNNGNVIQIKRIILNVIEKMKASNDDTVDRTRIMKFKTILADIETLKNMYRVRALMPRVGSDSTGHSPRLYGMGLVVADSLPALAKRAVEKQKHPPRLVLPFQVDTALRITYPTPRDPSSRLGRFFQAARQVPWLQYAGLRGQKEWVAREYSTRMVSRGNIVTLGGQQADSRNNLMDAFESETYRVHHSFRYLHSHLKNILKVIAGFIPAFLTFYLTHDWWILMYFGAFIWFGITGMRNIVQSVMGGGGMRRSSLLRWNDFISWDRLSDSLFFTGFSVPLLDYLVKTLMLNRGMGITTTTDPILLYAIMAAVNGIYLTSHNLFRGLQREAAFANFFRSVLSIPVAFGFNMAIGGLLGLFGIAGINAILQSWAAVISKTASDCVAGFIEGFADRATNIHNRLSDYRQKLEQLFDTYARLEILFPESDVLDLLEHPKAFLKAADQESRDLIMVLIINALDLLYFWMYQPRARTAFRELIYDMEPDERRILIKTQTILKMEREISLMFIDGIAGRNFSRSLAFYLDRSGEYLKSVDRLSARVESAER